MGEFRETPAIGDSGEVAKPHYYNHPTIWGLQAVEVIQDFSYNKATAMGYIWRAGRKPGEDEVKDLKKARDHIDFEISRIERLRSQSTNKA